MSPIYITAFSDHDTQPLHLKTPKGISVYSYRLFTSFEAPGYFSERKISKSLIDKKIPLDLDLNSCLV